ncbi:MAG: elongation factor P [bacterium]|jgi:elongation factor P
MLAVTDLRKGAAFQDEGELWRVLEYKHIKVARGGATIKVKVRNVNSGSITEKSYNSGDKVEPANITNYPAQYLYPEGENFIFMDTNTYEQFPINAELLGLGVNFLQDNMIVDVQFFDERPIGIQLPPSVVLEVTYTEPAVKGNSSGNITKPATVSSGYKLNVPSFVNTGDKIKINTDSGEYIERA